jgi:hypothetical protein
MKQLSNFLRPTVGAWSLRTHLAFSPTVPDQIAMSCCKCASCSRNRQMRAYSTSRGNQIGRGRTRSLPSVPSLAGTCFLVSVSFLSSSLPSIPSSSRHFHPFSHSSHISSAVPDSMKNILKGNKAWAKKVSEEDPSIFTRMAAGQSPKYLYFGCSDSRIPANHILGLGAGEVNNPNLA